MVFAQSWCVIAAQVACLQRSAVHHDGMLYGDMIIAHALIEELGSRRAEAFLSLLEQPHPPLAQVDAAALQRFIERVEEQFGGGSRVADQFRRLHHPDTDGCP